MAMRLFVVRVRIKTCVIRFNLMQFTFCRCAQCGCDRAIIVTTFFGRASLENLDFCCRCCAPRHAAKSSHRSDARALSSFVRCVVVSSASLPRHGKGGACMLFTNLWSFHVNVYTERERAREHRFIRASVHRCNIVIIMPCVRSCAQCTRKVQATANYKSSAIVFCCCDRCSKFEVKIRSHRSQSSELVVMCFLCFWVRLPPNTCAQRKPLANIMLSGKAQSVYRSFSGVHAVITSLWYRQREQVCGFWYAHGHKYYSARAGLE